MGVITGRAGCDWGGAGCDGHIALPSSLVVDENERASEPAQPDSSSGAGPGAEAGAEESAAARGAATQVRLRRAPRYRSFVVTGVLVGLALAGVVATAVPLTEGYSLRAVYTYVALPLGLVGALIGAGAAILLERRR